MKRLFALVVFFVCLTASSQEFGAFPIKANGVFDKFAKPNYRMWQRQPAKNDVIIKFEKTPKGLDEALKLVKQMLERNKLNFTAPDIYKSEQSPDLSKTTTAALQTALQSGNTKILEGWFAPDASTLFLSLSKGSYEINVLGAFKS